MRNDGHWTDGRTAYINIMPPHLILHWQRDKKCESIVHIADVRWRLRTLGTSWKLLISRR